MIGSLKGQLQRVDQLTQDIIVNVNGVGYLVQVSAQTLLHLPTIGKVVDLEITTIAREDALSLYGFLTRIEQKVFSRLTAVSGIGPKQAMQLLSHCEALRLANAIADRNQAYLESVKGVGKKKAAKLVVELRDVMRKLLDQANVDTTTTTAFSSPSVHGDLESALLQLGYRRPEIESVISKLAKEVDQNLSLEDALRFCLKELGNKAVAVPS